jgi:hypothetical protein
MQKFLSLVTFILVLSCNEPLQKTVPTKSKAAPEVRSCYQYVGDKDIIVLMLISKNDTITGTLSYTLYQKDNSRGTIQGQMRGDLLVADYTFQSEGVLSKRQVAFKKSGTTFIEGYGEATNENNRIVFKNLDSLDFSHSVILNKVLCK